MKSVSSFIVRLAGDVKFNEMLRDVRKKACSNADAIGPIKLNACGRRIREMESGIFTPDPHQVLLMTNVFKDQDLGDAYCLQVCPLGRKRSESKRCVTETLEYIRLIHADMSDLVQTAIERVISGAASDEERMMIFAAMSTMRSLKKRVEDIESFFFLEMAKTAVSAAV